MTVDTAWKHGFGTLESSVACPPLFGVSFAVLCRASALMSRFAGPSEASALPAPLALGLVSHCSESRSDQGSSEGL
jgi:hypothetical protein